MSSSCRWRAASGSGSADDVTVSRLPVAALVRLDEAGGCSTARRGVPRRPRRDAPGAARPLRRHAGADRPGSRPTRSSTCARANQHPAATAAPSSIGSRRRRGRCSTRTPRGTGPGILQDRRPDVAILAAAGRGNVDGEPVQGSLAGFVGAPGVARAAAEGDPLAPRRLAARLLDRDRRRSRPRGDRAPGAEVDARDARLSRRPRRLRQEVSGATTERRARGVRGARHRRRDRHRPRVARSGSRPTAPPSPSSAAPSRASSTRRRASRTPRARPGTAGACSTSSPT